MDPIEKRPFPVYLIEDDGESALFDVALSFEGKELDERQLMRWDVSLRRTFGLLALAGGCGGDRVDPRDTGAEMSEVERLDSDEGDVLYRWRIDPARLDPACLSIVFNLIEYGMFNLVTDDDKLRRVTEVFVDSTLFHGVDPDALDLPELWPTLPYELIDHNPSDADFDIEIEFTETVNDTIHHQFETRIKPWVLTLERGGFLQEHPRKSWECGRDTSEEPFRRTPLSLFVQVRGMYADYRAVWSLFNLLARAHHAVHPIAAVHVGE